MMPLVTFWISGNEDKYMTKAILVMDMPDSCFHCDCCHEKPYDRRYRIEGEKFCGIEDMEVSEYYDSFYSEEPMRPSWCPLKEMPEKMKYCNGTYNGEVKGWNLCLEEILERIINTASVGKGIRQIVNEAKIYNKNDKSRRWRLERIE